MKWLITAGIILILTSCAHYPVVETREVVVTPVKTSWTIHRFDYGLIDDSGPVDVTQTRVDYH